MEQPDGRPLPKPETHAHAQMAKQIARQPPAVRYISDMQSEGGKEQRDLARP